MIDQKPIGQSGADEMRRGRDIRVLEAAFQEAFDASAVEQQMGSVVACVGRGPMLGARRGDELGEGTHFVAWRCKSQNTSPEGLSLVLKLAKPEFWGYRGRARQRWLAGLRSLKDSNLPLIPPFTIIEQGESLAMVMPFLPQAAQAAAPYWQPLRLREEELSKALSVRGLTLKGLTQIACVGGVPFIYDLSDLQPTTGTF